MPLTWTHENPATWDADKAAVIDGAGRGAFPDLADRSEGDLLGSEWWRVERDGELVGYGWLDATWGWAPILLAVTPEAQGTGVGRFIVQNLQAEARKRGLAYLFNVVAATHPEPRKVRSWLEAQGFEPSSSDSSMLRMRVPPAGR